jgi:predicted MFS family arabinose efflux permease
MQDPPIGARPVGALIALSVAAFAYVTSEALPIGLLSLISRGTHSSLRAVGLLFAGSSLAGVLGVPAGTWLGLHFGWRIAFGALSLLGLLTMLAMAWLLPAIKPGEGEAARGTAPDARRYWLTLAVVSLAVTGSFASFTYVVPFLTQVSRFSLGTLGLILLVRGFAGLAGVFMGSRLAEWNPWIAIGIPVGGQALALCALYLAGAQPVAAVITVSLAGLSFSAMCTAITGRVLQVAPGSVDMATAGTSIAVNVGITAGAFLGGVLLPGFGVRSTALAGGLLSIAALAAVFGELLLRSRPASPAPVPGLRQPARGRSASPGRPGRS